MASIISNHFESKPQRERERERISFGFLKQSYVDLIITDTDFNKGMAEVHDSITVYCQRHSI